MQMEALSQAVERLTAAGYRDDFRAEPGGLASGATRDLLGVAVELASHPDLHLGRRVDPPALPGERSNRDSELIRGRMEDAS